MCDSKIELVNCLFSWTLRWFWSWVILAINLLWMPLSCDTCFICSIIILYFVNQMFLCQTVHSVAPLIQIQEYIIFSLPVLKCIIFNTNSFYQHLAYISAVAHWQLNVYPELATSHVCILSSFTCCFILVSDNVQMFSSIEAEMLPLQCDRHHCGTTVFEVCQTLVRCVNHIFKPISWQFKCVVFPSWHLCTQGKHVWMKANNRNSSCTLKR